MDGSLIPAKPEPRAEPSEVCSRIERILLGSPAGADGRRLFLKAVCEGLGFEVAFAWSIDWSRYLLRCVDHWGCNSRTPWTILAASSELTVSYGLDLPGRVWAIGHPSWIPDLTQDRGFLRGSAAARDGLRSALAFPVRDGGEVLGVVELFRRRVGHPDPASTQASQEAGLLLGRWLATAFPR